MRPFHDLRAAALARHGEDGQQRAAQDAFLSWREESGPPLSQINGIVARTVARS